MRIHRVESFQGRFELPGDKSLSHRYALLGALANGESRISNFATAADCASTLTCLEGLGVGVDTTGPEVLVRGTGHGGLRPPAGPLDAGNSGSTLRMLAGILAGLPFRSELTGDASLLRRPVERIAAPLRAMGARVATQDGKPPLVIEGAALRGIEWRSPVASAQVKTAVLLAGLQAEGRTVVREPRASRDHTERLLPLFGVPLERDGLTVSVTGGARLSPARARVPGDASTAAFLVVAALIVPGSSIRIDNLLLNPTRTGFIEVLKAMGADITTGIESETPEPVGWLEARSSQLEGVPITAELVPSLIDELPVLAVAGACANGRLEISGAAELRVKESDRIAAVAEGLTALGAHVSERPDGLVVDGGHPLEGSRVRSFGDHRIAMAMAVAGMVAAGETELEGAECAAVSCPEFFELLERGARE